MRPLGLRHCCSWLGVLALASSVSGQTSRVAEASSASTRSATAASATTQAADSNIDPQAILKQLASTDWHQRKAATESLVALGEPGKPFIEELVRSATDAEARNNAQAALSQIDDNRLTGPSYITLHLKNATPAKAMAMLAPQTFTTLPTVPENLWQMGGFGAVNIDVDHVPFWEVAPKICAQLGVNFQPHQNTMRIMRGGGQIQGISVVEGPFLIVADQLTYTRNRMLGAGNREQSRFGMTLSIYPEPKLTVLPGRGNVRIDEAVDDHGNSLLPKQTQMPNFMNFGGYGGFNLFANLQYPTKNPGTRIVRFRASTTFLLQTKVRDFTVENPAETRNVPINISGMSVTFKDLLVKPDYYEVHFSVPQTAMQHPQFQSLANELQTRLRLIDAHGTEIDHRGMGTNMNGQTFDFNVQFARDNRNANRRPIRLVWEIPLESREITVPIRFNDIPLFDDN